MVDDGVDEATRQRQRERGAHPQGRLCLRVIGDDVFATHPLPASGEVVLGRGTTADVRIEDSSLSRKHAVLHLGPPLRIEDLGSVNGTRIGERQLRRGESVEIVPGEVVEVGAVMIMVQRGVGADRPRRLWTHGYFEARLEEECARARRTQSCFAVLRLHVDGAIEGGVVQETLTSMVRETDLIGAYAPREYEVLLVELGPDDVEGVAAQIQAKLSELGAKIRLGIACYPRDGLTAESLVARACGAVNGTSAEPASLPALVEGGVMQRLHKLVDRIAAVDIRVLLLGETGVGKEVMAETIHARSARARKPLLKINCATLSETLLESELFGYERGAFTGAVQAKPGLLESAAGGTVFLDEIGELQPSLQGKLLRVFEEGKVLRVGALTPRPIDVRFIAATNRDLEVEIARGRFRQDLFFRLNGMSLLLPPLRERRSEIEGLATTFVREASRKAGRKRAPELSAETRALLLRYSWPGNIRELRNVMERAIVLCLGDVITPEHLPMEKMGDSVGSTAPTSVSAPASIDEQSNLPTQLESVERQRILEALTRCGGNQTQAAQLLGISRKVLIARLDSYGVPRPRKKS
jgi:two-component system response regulator AtoC